MLKIWVIWGLRFPTNIKLAPVALTYYKKIKYSPRRTRRKLQRSYKFIPDLFKFLRELRVLRGGKVFLSNF